MARVVKQGEVDKVRFLEAFRRTVGMINGSAHIQVDGPMVMYTMFTMFMKVTSNKGHFIQVTLLSTWP